MMLTLVILLPYQPSQEFKHFNPSFQKQTNDQIKLHFKRHFEMEPQPIISFLDDYGQSDPGKSLFWALLLRIYLHN